ncbi:MAG: SDR family oxidoreductase [Bacteroidetes bacterium]|nr:SDR family oxidoreductase [Bacteroidota bacterium]MBU1117039.1 SDR family oxidoreductase [Bacteroidota bacterium]MBU1797634.1 SDR family oxidoreductase [Bacteroidota bacterium]
MKRFDGKVAVVTGGARDIGRQTSIRLAREGASVCVNYYDNPEDAQETLRIIEADGGNAIAVKGDMTNHDDINNLVAKCIEAFGDKIHTLINVAGGLVARKTMGEMDWDFWNFVMKLNLGTVFMVTKAVLPYMPEGSSIVNFSSQAARDGGGPGASAYATSKGGVLTFTKGLAKELGPKNIRVNCVSPGMINTTFHDTFTKPEVRKNVAAGTPLRREGNASEVADLAVYLASNDASFITGASIEINGGTYFV